jgi:hypothetical protein
VLDLGTKQSAGYRLPLIRPLIAPLIGFLTMDAGDQARMRFIEFFTANIRNPNMRRSYAKAAEESLAWCSFAGVPSIAAVQPVHVATYIETLAASAARRPSRRVLMQSVISSIGWLSGTSCR